MFNLANIARHEAQGNFKGASQPRGYPRGNYRGWGSIYGPRRVIPKQEGVPVGNATDEKWVPAAQRDPRRPAPGYYDGPRRKTSELGRRCPSSGNKMPRVRNKEWKTRGGGIDSRLWAAEYAAIWRAILRYRLRYVDSWNWSLNHVS